MVKGDVRTAESSGFVYRICVARIDDSKHQTQGEMPYNGYLKVIHRGGHDYQLIRKIPVRTRSAGIFLCVTINNS